MLPLTSLKKATKILDLPAQLTQPAGDYRRMKFARASCQDAIIVMSVGVLFILPGLAFVFADLPPQTAAGIGRPAQPSD